MVGILGLAAAVTTGTVLRQEVAADMARQHVGATDPPEVGAGMAPLHGVTEDLCEADGHRHRRRATKDPLLHMTGDLPPLDRTALVPMAPGKLLLVRQPHPRT